ncbi:hypothetical protein DFH28DRAFT_1082487 [Melampsora americana]|nr:hypothetical protein DFH28DRAFT_1082487 [Melampsora americana]
MLTRSTRYWLFVRRLRYCTKQHRLTCLHFAALHKNDLGRMNAVQCSLRHLARTENKLKMAHERLTTLERTHGLSINYFEEQWNRKKELQSQALSQTSADYLQLLSELVELEEKLVSAQERLAALQRKKRSKRGGRKKQAMLSLPNTMVQLEEAMDNVTSKLGTVEFLELTGVTDARAKPLIKITVAKGRLIEAKSGVLEHRRRAGTARELRRKHSTYNRLAGNYNAKFAPNEPLSTPTLMEVERMEITDPFFNCGNLTHPQEPWAVDPRTQDGIEAYLDVQRCEEELRRIAKEARQMMNWGLAFQDKIDVLQDEIRQGILPLWAASKDSMQALHSTLMQQSCRIWIRWQENICTLVNLTTPPLGCHKEDDREKCMKWRNMVKKSRAEWEHMVQGVTIEGEGGEDEGDVPEGEEDVPGPDDDVEQYEVDEHVAPEWARV